MNNSSRPAIFNFHGYGGSGAGMASTLNGVAEDETWVHVYPDGSGLVRRSIFDLFVPLTALEEAWINPNKHSDTRNKPLALTNDHGRCMAVTPERALASVEGCPLNL